MEIIVGKQNTLTYSFAVSGSTGTLTISGEQEWDLGITDLNRVIDTTNSNAQFKLSSTTTFSFTVVNGLFQWTWNFTNLPNGTSQSDQLIIYISVTPPQAILALQQYIDSIPPLPTLGLITDFNFTLQSSVTLVSGNVSSIIDQIGSVVSSQGTAGARPVYNTSETFAYATFDGTKTLSGNLLTSSTTFTMVVLRRCNHGSTFEIGSFSNGNNGSTGYGIVDYQNLDTAYGMAGGWYPGTGQVATDNYVSFDNVWDIIIFSFSASTPKFYNMLGVFFSTQYNFSPQIPVGGHTIGQVNFGGLNKFKGDIARCLLYNRQVTDAEALQIGQNLAGTYNLPLPFQVVAGGDSRFTGFASHPPCPTKVIVDFNPAHYSFVYNTAVVGYTTGNILSNLSTAVLPAKQTSVKNIYILMAGVNDIGALTGTQIYNNLVAICTQVRAWGFLAVICTDIYSTDATRNLTVDVYNGLIRSNWATFADAMADTNATLTPTMMANTFYSPDGLHQNINGSILMAPLIETAIIGLL